MTTCKALKRKELDKILKKTKFSSKTKALMTYYSSGITTGIVGFVNAIEKANIPKKDVKALALFLYDASRNGRPNIAGYSAFSVREWEIKIYSSPKFVWRTYNSMREKTLVLWNEAIKLIDA